jgi:TPR repeat protein
MNKTLLKLLTILFCITSNVVSSADYQKGLDAVKKGNYAIALNQFKPMAERGCGLCQHKMGWLYEKGLGVITDYKTALKWYTLAVKQQDLAWVNVHIGRMHERGLGVSQNYDTATTYYSLAAKSGYDYDLRRISDLKDGGRKRLNFWKFFAKLEVIDAIINIGSMYYNGEGVYQSYKIAIIWYRRAAELKDARALSKLGMMHNQGLGTSKNKTHSYMWFTLANLQHDAEAKIKIASISKTMNSSQIAIAENLVRECIHRKYKKC